jgi:hypothetical protein
MWDRTGFGYVGFDTRRASFKSSRSLISPVVLALPIGRNELNRIYNIS